MRLHTTVTAAYHRGMRSTRATLVVSLLAVSGGAHAQPLTPLPLFEDSASLELTIEAPLRALKRNADDRQEHAAVLRYRSPSGQEYVFDIEVRIRGKSRLQFCDFPPLRIDFDTDALEGSIFAGQDHLKLVTLCGERDSYRENLAEEYQIYRAYNVLNDYSFRVRWAEVEYVVTDSRREETITEPAFFIEEDWEVARRNGLEALELEAVPLADLDVRQGALLALFQYMIGNTDYSPITAAPDEDCCHNGKPLGAEGGRIFVLPYDFDHAGLVAADYAEPRSHLPITSVRQRLYRGYCATNAGLTWAVQRFNEKRSAIERIFDDDHELVDERTRRRTREYVAEFYEVINDPEELQDEIIEQCRD